MICFVYMNVRESARERVRGWGGQRKRVRKCQYQSVGSCVKKIVVALPVIPVKAQHLSVQVHPYQYECTRIKVQRIKQLSERTTEETSAWSRTTRVSLTDKCLPVLSVTHQLTYTCIGAQGRYQQKLETAKTMHSQKIRSAEDKRQL